MLGEDYVVYVASDSKSDVFEEFYAENDVKIINLKNVTGNSFINKIPKVRGFYSIFKSSKLLKSVGVFDVIHVHLVNMAALRLAISLKNKATRLIISYWGSDLFRKTDKLLKKQTKYLDKADVITLSTKEMVLKFKSVFGDYFDKKIRSVLFGVSGFEHICKVKKEYNVAECKNMMGMDKNSIAVAVGYNRSPFQQHDKVLERIANLPNEIQEQIQIILQMGYGTREEAYFNHLEEIIKKLKCKIITLDKFLSDDDVAILRNAVDIYINAQKTDAFSASVQEYLYACKIVLNPIWIKYHELQDNDIYDIKYKTFDELEQLLLQIITEIETYKNNYLKNEKIYNLSSWQASKKKWLECYKN